MSFVYLSFLEYLFKYNDIHENILLFTKDLYVKNYICVYSNYIYKINKICTIYDLNINILPC